MFELFPDTEAPNYKLKFYNTNFEIFCEVSYDYQVIGIVLKRILKKLIPIDRVKSLNEPWYNLKPATFEENKHFNCSIQEIIPLTGDKYSPIFKQGALTLYPKSDIKIFNLYFYDLNETLIEDRFSPEIIFQSGAEIILGFLIKQGKVKMEEAPFYYEIAKDTPAESNSKRLRITLSANLFQPFYPNSEGAFRLPKLEKERSRIKFKKVELEPLPVLQPAKFRNTTVKGNRGREGIGRVILHRQVYNSLVKRLKLSRASENGGYLVGHAYRLEESPEQETAAGFKWAIEITDVIKSDFAKGNAVILMFTHDSWSEIKKMVDTEFYGKKLVSWFHTHLFAASETFGLSGLDQKLHRHFFTKPWQVALLLNIDNSGQRELRCFQMNRKKTKLVETTYEILDINETVPSESFS